MTVTTLFKAWEALQETLRDPTMPDDETDLLVDRSRHLILTLTHTPAAGLLDVLLKLEAYGREVEAGPCEECDALLASALHDRALILAGLERTGLAAAGRGEHRAGGRGERRSTKPPYEEPPAPNEPHAQPSAARYRGQNPRPPYSGLGSPATS